MNRSWSPSRRFMTVVLVFAAGIMIGRLSLDASVGIAQDRGRDDTERRAFRSGSARSEDVLRNMDATLQRIESSVSSIDEKMNARQED